MGSDSDDIPMSSDSDDVPTSSDSAEDGNSGSIQDRISIAFAYIKIFTDFEISYQFWAPVMVGRETVLTSLHQPFWCNFPQEKHYREKCSAHNYGIDRKKEEQLGPPGRVFLRGLPEFSPNLKYYSTKEYYLRDYAVSYGFEEYCALPVFESLGEHCVGVLELLAYYTDGEIWEIAKQVFIALQGVGLASSRLFFHKCGEIPEIFPPRAYIERQLNDLCDMHKFPIARVWKPSTCTDSATHGGRQKIRVPNGTHEITGFCMYAEDHCRENTTPEIRSFNRACTYLEKQQGLVGKAFSSGMSCFCKDITQFSMTNYRFLHYARDCKLTSCFAIWLNCVDPRYESLILELFLAPGRMHTEDPQALLRSLLTKMFLFRSVKEGEELLEAHSFTSDDNVDYFQISPSRGPVNDIEASENERDQEQIPSSSYNGGEEREVRVTNSDNERGIELEGEQGDAGAGISDYELVKQHFGRKLADAAASLGVSPSTLKRRCRKLNIQRWPSHRRTKVDPIDVERTGKYPTLLPTSNVVPGEGTSATCTAVQDINTMIVKATCGDQIIRFSLSLSSGIEDLRRKIAMRLEVARYKIQYKDEDGDWILMACNEDLYEYMQGQKVLGKISIRLVPIDNPNSNSQLVAK